MKSRGLLSSLTLATIFAMSLPVSLAADLKGPIDLSSAKVLPQGVRNFRYKGASFPANDKFTNTGNTAVLADPFFKKLTWHDLVDPKVDPEDKGLLKGYLQAQGWDLNEEVGSTTGDISVDAQAHVPVLAYGLTRKITMAVAVPVVRYKFNVDTSFVAGANARKLDNQLKKDRKTFERAEFNEKMVDPIGTKVKDFNYEPLVSESGTKLGDIKVVTKYLLSQSDRHALTIQPEVTLPTGKEANVNKIVDVAPGDGQWDVGLSLLTDWYATDRFTVSSQLGYIWQLPDQTSKRIPYRQDSTLSNDIDRETDRDLGDQVLGQVGVKYEVLKGFSLNTGYAFQYKDKDRYAGNNYEQGRYQWLEANTYQRMHSVQVGAGYSTLRLFQEKAFPVPLEGNLTVTKPVEGKNVTEDTVASVEFAMYF